MNAKVNFLLILLLYISTGINNVSGQYPGAGQRMLNPANVPQFVDPLPHDAGNRVNVKNGGHLFIKAMPCEQVSLSTGTLLRTGIVGSDENAGKTHFWAYSLSTNGIDFIPPRVPAVTIDARRGRSLQVTYMNKLYGQSYRQMGLPVDQTVDWAAPTTTGNPSADPYTDSLIPMVVHLHGGEVESMSDGAPNAWFTQDYKMTGPDWGIDGTSQDYLYPNRQEATTLWLHDHAMGVTRLNIYAGMLGMYFLRGEDEERDRLPGFSRDNLVREVQPAGTSGVYNPQPYLPEIELVIQDRMFDENGQLYFTVDPPNPEIHPLWGPEFFGNIITVNGKTWPYLSVAPRKYRFRILNASNARFFNLKLGDPETGTNGPMINVIGTDGGLLNSPVALDPSKGQSLLIAPSERYDVVIDFSNSREMQKWTLMNDANAPYPGGDPVDPQYTGQVMQFVVNGLMVNNDEERGPGIDRSRLPDKLRRDKIVKLTNFDGTINLNPAVTRQLTLVEVEGDNGPAVVTLNNSAFDANGMNQEGYGETELPQEGKTELWQIINTTEDAHPIHIHLIQGQIVSRQPFDAESYDEAYEASFPGGTFQPFSGPPMPYATVNNDGAVGGNPAVSTYLTDNARVAGAEEQGWKDVFKVFPGEVTTLIIRYAPIHKSLNSPPDQLLYAFDPGKGPGYVWHCHILDHEDNQMMRPYKVIPAPSRSSPGTEGKMLLAGLKDDPGLLQQNYPNPVSSTALIQYSVPSTQHVSLKLYNFMGDEVNTLVDRVVEAGKHELMLSADLLPNGIYFYSLQIGNTTQTRKMLVSR